MASFYPRVFTDLTYESDPFIFASESEDVEYRSAYEPAFDAFDGDGDQDFLDYCDESSVEARRDLQRQEINCRSRKAFRRRNNGDVCNRF